MTRDWLSDSHPTIPTSTNTGRGHPSTGVAAAAAMTSGAEPPTTTVPFKLVSWNVASLPSLEAYINHEKGCMANFLASLGCDVFCVQETKLNPAQLNPKQKPHLLPDGWLSYWAVGNKPGYCGIATYVKPHLAPTAVYTDAELFAEEEDDKGEVGTLGAEGRLVVTEHAVGGARLVVFNTYVPNAGGAGRPRLAYKLCFMDALYRQMEDYRSRGFLVLLAGDLNVVMDEEKDEHPDLRPKNGKTGWSEGEWAWVSRALGHGNAGGPYIDSFRRLNPTERTYSFWNQVTDDRGRNVGLRIDYVLVSQTGWGADGGGPEDGKGEGEGKGSVGIVAAEVLLTALRSTRASDHAPVMVELALPPTTATAAAGAEEEVGEAKGKKHVGCVKHKVDGTVVLQKLLPAKGQKSITGFFSKKPAGGAAAAASSAAEGASGEPAAKKAKTEAAGAGKGKGGGGPMMKFLAKKK